MIKQRLFTHNNLEVWTPELCTAEKHVRTTCVYALLQKWEDDTGAVHQKIVYVGSTLCLKCRLYQHHHSDKDFDKSMVLKEFTDVSRARKYEKMVIRRLRPVYNIQHNPNNSHNVSNGSKQIEATRGNSK